MVKTPRQRFASSKRYMPRKTALITGGSRGIGFAIAEAFAADSYDVVLVARNTDDLNAAAARIPGARAIALDITDIEGVQHAVSSLATLDVLVNAAGVIEPIGPVEQVDPAAWLTLMQINVFGTFLMTHACVPLLAQSTSGTIINFVGGGEGAFPQFSAYAASKGAVARFTETVAAELLDKNISVNAIAPGAVNTDMTEHMIRAGEQAGAQYDRAVKQKSDETATPEKAVALARWLTSDDARTITGKIISAQWDNYTRFTEHSDEINRSDIFTMRRVRPKDRGMAWDM
jgi:NAD(P)-dependent dehydrogenase (short-subunit alcohol dehydrogenase family)